MNKRSLIKEVERLKDDIRAYKAKLDDFDTIIKSQSQVIDKQQRSHEKTNIGRLKKENYKLKRQIDTLEKRLMS